MTTIFLGEYWGSYAQMWVLPWECWYSYKGNLTPMCRTFLLVLTADLGIPVGILSFLCADVSIAVGVLMFIWGKPNAEMSDIFIRPHEYWGSYAQMWVCSCGGNLTPMCRIFLLVLTADLGIPGVILRFLCADVSITIGILMFIWGKPNAEVSDISISPHRWPQYSHGTTKFLMCRCEYCQGNTDVHMGET